MFFFKVFILGDGGFAKELEAYYRSCGCINVELVPQDQIKEYQEKHNKHDTTILGSGKCEIKKKMAEEAVGEFAQMIHPKSSVLTLSSNLGEGIIVAPGAVIAPNAILKNHVLVNYNATIGHDTIIGDFSVVSPNAAVGGCCELGSGVYVGAGATIKEGLKIASGVTIGMGAVVIKDILKAGTYVGVPAKLLERES